MAHACVGTFFFMLFHFEGWCGVHTSSPAPVCGDVTWLGTPADSGRFVRGEISIPRPRATVAGDEHSYSFFHVQVVFFLEELWAFLCAAGTEWGDEIGRLCRRLVMPYT